MEFTTLTQKEPDLNILTDKPIAYFCAEFALTDALPIFSGGLGVLAGDVIRQANQSQIPLIGVGLLYKEGYFKQVITDSGLQDELPAYLDLAELPIHPAKNKDGQEVRLELLIASRTIFVRAWEYKEGSIPVYLLDTDLEENAELDRRLTLTLYPASNEWRIQQEIILGIGGVKLLSQLGFEPFIYHLNEGHSAFAVLEITHAYMALTKGDFTSALKHACDRIVFTNHTLIPSGNDVFATELVEQLLNEYASHLPLPTRDILQMGLPSGQKNLFSMTHLALSASKVRNAVSRSQAEIAKTIWPDHGLLAITNGVNSPYWQAEPWQRITEKFAKGLEVTDDEIWTTHQNLKYALVQTLAELTGIELHPHTLTLTWARRVAAYKQPLLLFSDMPRLARLLSSTATPVQIIIAGKAHPGDLPAKAIIEEMLKLTSLHNLGNRILFLPNYNLDLAKLLTRGSDVWLNTPEKGKEACGTSGMKAALNGVLQCAIADGWTAEVDLANFGFLINNYDSADDLYRLLESKIIPLYYKRDSNDMPSKWCQLMRETLLMAAPTFTTERMMQEYMELLYLPIINQ